ncbi:hypothetical protein [Neobacillus niacini]|uniref:hypothetical protein n=1 Tax=Neobacillus niacini TaxID=86668 RepID=UPI002859C6CB|nr:hypothetical protein [Neobacillus niacini]MDR7001419.1 putative OB-fold protein [Neobacillus niacini]
MEITVVVCKGCGHQAIPPKYGCPRCSSGHLVEKKQPGAGSIYSVTMSVVDTLMSFQHQIVDVFHLHNICS